MLKKTGAEGGILGLLVLLAVTGCGLSAQPREEPFGPSIASWPEGVNWDKLEVADSSSWPDGVPNNPCLFGSPYAVGMSTFPFPSEQSKWLGALGKHFGWAFPDYTFRITGEFDPERRVSLVMSAQSNPHPTWSSTLRLEVGAYIIPLRFYDRSVADDEAPAGQLLNDRRKAAIERLRNAFNITTEYNNVTTDLFVDITDKYDLKEGFKTSRTDLEELLRKIRDRMLVAGYKTTWIVMRHDQNQWDTESSPTDTVVVRIFIDMNAGQNQPASGG